MNANMEKHLATGQRVWLDNISREMLNSGALPMRVASR